MLCLLVGGLDEPDALLPTLHALGESHRGFGAKPAHYFTVGEAMIDTLAELNGAADYTRVNGVPVETSRELHEGDRIELGQVVLRFQLRVAQPRQRRAAGAS